MNLIGLIAIAMLIFAFALPRGDSAPSGTQPSPGYGLTGFGAPSNYNYGTAFSGVPQGTRAYHSAAYAPASFSSGASTMGAMGAMDVPIAMGGTGGTIVPARNAFGGNSQKDSHLSRILDSVDHNSQMFQPAPRRNLMPNYGVNQQMGVIPYGSGAGVPLSSGIAPYGRMQQAVKSGNPFSNQNLLQTFLSGGTGGFGTGSSGNFAAAQAVKDNSIQGQAESLCQRANAQAAQALSDEELANTSSGNDQATRQGCASSAQSHANDARAAAEQAESLSYSSTGYAKDYAAQARAAANRAQEAADRAAYNAVQ